MGARSGIQLHPVAAAFLVASFNDKSRIGSMSTVELPTRPFCSVADAAELVGCTVGRIRQLLIDGEIIGMKLNERAWAVDRKSAAKYAKKEFNVGRPRLAKQA